MSTLKEVFLNSMQFCNYVFKSGKLAHFIHGKYMTNNETEIEELKAEIDAGHPFISQSKVEAERVVDITKLDPLAAIKATAVAEYLQRQAAEADPVTRLAGIVPEQRAVPKPMGTTASVEELKSRLNFTNSASIADGAADSSSGASV